MISTVLSHFLQETVKRFDDERFSVTYDSASSRGASKYKLTIPLDLKVPYSMKAESNFFLFAVVVYYNDLVGYMERSVGHPSSSVPKKVVSECMQALDRKSIELILNPKGIKDDKNNEEIDLKEYVKNSRPFKDKVYKDEQKINKQKVNKVKKDNSGYSWCTIL